MVVFIQPWQITDIKDEVEGISKRLIKHTHKHSLGYVRTYKRNRGSIQEIQQSSNRIPKGDN